MSCAASTSLHTLVTQNLVETKKFYCPFLERGFCRDSSRCNFSHDHYASIKIPNDYCHFYLANQCLYGQDCKFRHSEPQSYEEPPELEERFFINDRDAPSSSDAEVGFWYAYSATSATDDGELPEEDVDDVGNQEPEGDADDKLHKNQKKGYPLCPYSMTNGICPFPTGQCSYIHGNDCDLCERPCLHPFNLEQQRQHREDCLKEHEREMELSFAVQRSKDKVCGICMDTVVEKKPITSSRFGILEKCNHIFCLDCIRKWRATKQIDTRTIRACPECRVNSDFVVPSKYWVEDQDDKEKLICDYKAALRSKPCRYFNEGKGECPFAGSCFYKHAYPDGRLAELSPPKPRRRLFGARRQSTAMTNLILWNIITSTNDDEWSNDDIDDIESLYDDTDYGNSDDEYADLEFLPR